MDSQMDNQDRQRGDTKQVYTHLMRAKLYGVIAINTLEGITHELDDLLPYELEKDNIDPFSERFRKYHNGVLYPTSYGDHMDRAIKSLGKDLSLPVSVDLLNTQAIKRALIRFIRSTGEEDREKVCAWLSMQNNQIMKSSRFDSLIDQCCKYFYNKPSSEVSDDNLSFIRRSANELLRNKASKEALRKKIMSPDNHMDDEDEGDMAIGYNYPPGYHDASMMDPSMASASHPISEYNNMTAISTVGGVVGLSSIPIPYDGVSVITTMNHLTAGVPPNMVLNREMDTSATNMSMSLPMAINIPTVNQMPLPVGVNLQPVSVSMVDVHRPYNPVGGVTEVAITRAMAVNENGGAVLEEGEVTQPST
ncbi:hypothetical protein WA538_000530 [Blastocystis sp. DL]